MIALFVFPAVPLAGDTKPRLRASSFLCHDFSDAPQSRFVEMSDKAFGRECEKLRKELEDSYNAYYMMLDDGGRRELFESEVFWEKYLRCYQKNLCDTLDRPLLIFTGEAKSPVITNVYREIVTDILRWRINDLKRWEKGRYLSNANNSTEDIERKLSGEMCIRDRATAMICSSTWLDIPIGGTSMSDTARAGAKCSVCWKREK